MPEEIREITVQIDIDAMTWDDFEFLTEMEQRTKDGKVSGELVKQLKAIFDRMVIGGVGKLPLRKSLTLIMAAIRDAMNDAGNPVDGQGKA